MAQTGRPGSRVLLTGVAGALARRLAERLRDRADIVYVAGTDLRVPDRTIPGTEFFHADLRTPDIAQVLSAARPDVIVHCSVVATPGSAGGRSRMKELNVIGTMQLLAAAQQARGLSRVVVRSTTAVYGASPDDPALFPEDAPVGDPSATGFTKDALEVESYARSFARRRPDVDLTILRYANLLGPTLPTSLSRYLSLPVVPTVLGYDPRLQLCHEEDALAVLERAAVGEHPGTYNVAGPGVVYLSQAVRLCRRPPLPVAAPLANPLAELVRRTGRVDYSPDQLRYLLYGRVGDITRLRTMFGYEPAYSAQDTVSDFITRRGPRGAPVPQEVRS